MLQGVFVFYRTFALGTLVSLSLFYNTNFSKHKIEFIPSKITLNKGPLQLKRGDILVKANHNNLVGSSFVESGTGFGHAAIVLTEGKDEDIISLLKRTDIFESHAREVAEDHQIRKIKAYKESTNLDSLNITFGNKYAGSRYVLRTNLPNKDIENIIKFVLDQDDCTSSWRATKDYSKSKYESPRNWYCTLLIWQAFYNVLDKDIDVNKGLIVYPNDIINSPLFAEYGTIIRF